MLRSEREQGSISRALSEVPVSGAASHVIDAPAKDCGELQKDISQRTTHAQPVVPASRSPITPHPPVSSAFSNLAEQAVSRLSEAARRIAEGDSPNRRPPRASRLAPFRDISAEIRRESTPLPKYARRRETNETTTPQEREAGKRAASTPAMPDLWPWLDEDVDERENEDTWAGRTDPLISRHIPNSSEAARIEEDDLRRILSEGISTNLLPAASGRRSTFSLLRLAFIILAVLAVVALVIDGVLLSVVFVRPHPASTAQGGPSTASLTLSTNRVDLLNGPQQVGLHIVNFASGTSVQLSHDIQEQVQTTTGSPVVTIGSNGSADVSIIINSSWQPGFHLIVAEDIKTRYTASATLLVVGKEQSRPARLLVDQSSLNFGNAVEGAATTILLHLSNSGSGSISWSASSDQPWLLISPSQGMFSQEQTIAVAAQRANLKAGDYKGSITISSSVGTAQVLRATMSVGAPPNGPVLALSPALLSFTTTDGSSGPAPQMLTISNPGTKILNWTLTSSSSSVSTMMVALAHKGLSQSSSWLSADLLSGSVPAGSSMQVMISVQSGSLLPGTYLGTLVFRANGVVDSPQTINVSLIVQPHCGLVTNVGSLTFTAVQGKTNPSNQVVNLNETSSCAGAPINWKAATSSQGWLIVTPGSGQLKGTTGEFISVGVNASGLPPRSYFGLINFTTQQSTQSVMVQLTVQPPPSAAEPVMSVSQLNLNFSNTSGQPNPKGQVVTIANNGGGTLYWSTSVTQFGSSWLGVSPTGGSILPGQLGQLAVNVSTTTLSPGTYSGQVTLNGRDASGKAASGTGQVVMVNVVVQPPCTVAQPSSSSLAFSAVQGSLAPPSQAMLITGTGNCIWPLSLSVSVPASASSWLSVTPTSGSIKGSGQSASFSVNVAPGALAPAVYSTQVSVSATDSAGWTAQGSPQSFSVSLTILPPCIATAPPASLSFSSPQGTSPSSQSITLRETGTCNRPITWTATGDAGSASWLSIAQPAADTGAGTSLVVGANASSLAPNTYSGTIMLTATDASGAVVQGSARTITVTLVVTPTVVTGTVYACPGSTPPTCLTPASLPGASLSIINGGGTTIATATTDASGNFTLTGLPPGSYIVNISGTDSGGTHYLTTGLALVVTSSGASGVAFQVFPG